MKGVHTNAELANAFQTLGKGNGIGLSLTTKVVRKLHGETLCVLHVQFCDHFDREDQ